MGALKPFSHPLFGHLTRMFTSHSIIYGQLYDLKTQKKYIPFQIGGDEVKRDQGCTPITRTILILNLEHFRA